MLRLGVRNWIKIARVKIILGTTYGWVAYIECGNCIYSNMRLVCIFILYASLLVYRGRKYQYIIHKNVCTLCYGKVWTRLVPYKSLRDRIWEESTQYVQVWPFGEKLIGIFAGALSRKLQLYNCSKLLFTTKPHICHMGILSYHWHFITVGAENRGWWKSGIETYFLEIMLLFI